MLPHYPSQIPRVDDAVITLQPNVWKDGCTKFPRANSVRSH